MARKSDTGNVYKRCDCTKRRESTCEHGWVFDWKPTGGKRIRKPLADLIGYHAPDRTTAEREAVRVIEALKNGEDPSGAVRGDDIMVGDLLQRYAVRHPNRRDRWQIPRLVIEIGAWRAADVTDEKLLEYREPRPIVAGNRDVSLLGAAFSEGVDAGLIKSTPFLRNGRPTIKKRPEQARSRRLHNDEYENLLAACRDNSDGQDLHDLIVAAVETGARSSELAQMQWAEVGEHTIFLPAIKTKTKRDRRVPISPDVLRPVLERRRLDPAGKALPPTAYVFGDACGRRVGSRDRAWAGAILRGNGHQPIYHPRTKNLTLECRGQLQSIDLHFHDLRREAASRWMDAGIPLATISRWLGHKNISQTSTYLAASLGGDEADIARYVASRQAHPLVTRPVTREAFSPRPDPALEK